MTIREQKMKRPWLEDINFILYMYCHAIETITITKLI
jgi:hypothetical protein